jgi:hypothetical protein
VWTRPNHATDSGKTVASVERVLWFVDRQIQAVLSDGAAAVKADLLEEDRPAAGAILERLPEGICSAVVTHVAKRGHCTVVKVRFTTADGMFTMITSWALGPMDRPWLVAMGTLDKAPALHLALPEEPMSPLGPPHSPPAFPHNQPLIMRRWQRRPRVNTAGGAGGGGGAKRAGCPSPTAIGRATHA